MMILPTHPNRDETIRASENTGSLTHSTAQKLVDILHHKKTPLSEGYIHPVEAIEPILGQVEHPTGVVPYSFETGEVLGRTWFKFHGKNKEGEGFMLSGSISGDSVNIQHILAEGFGQQVRPALEKHLTSIGIKTVYATFSRPTTANAFVAYSDYHQVTPEDIPSGSYEKLGLCPQDITRTLYSPEFLQVHVKKIREIQKQYGDNLANLYMGKYFENKQMLLKKDISV